jgi:hypothetical protein
MKDHNIDVILAKLYRFVEVDKYISFSEALPGIDTTPYDIQDIIVEILDNCAKELIKAYRSHKRPTQVILKEIITRYMNEIATADVNPENKDFGYELCWFLSEKAGVNFKKSSEQRLWGFWKVEANQVKLVSGVRKRKKQE